MKTTDDLKQQLEQFTDATVDTEKVPGALCYLVNDNLFAVYYNTKNPRQISLRCDPNLARSLRAQFESVMPANNLDKKEWNTIVVTPQIEDKINDLVVHSYHLTAAK